MLENLLFPEVSYESKKTVTIHSLISNFVFRRLAAANMNTMMQNFAQKSKDLKLSMENIRESLSGMKTAVGECAIGVTNVTETAVRLTENVSDIGKEAELNLDIAVGLNDEVGKFKL